MTNFERIKAMSVSELIETLGYGSLCSHIKFSVCEKHGNCDGCMREWLESEVQDEAD